MVPIIALIVLVVCSSTAVAQETRPRRTADSSISPLEALRDLLTVKSETAVVRPPARIAGRPAKPRAAPKPADAAALSTLPPTALAPVGASVPATALPAFPIGNSPLHRCKQGQRVMSGLYSQGVVTASGDPFDPDAMTAAHRTLPFGSTVVVINPRNGRTVTVTINDRGPFVTGVTIDLSAGAARAIGMSDTQAVCIL